MAGFTYRENTNVHNVTATTSDILEELEKWNLGNLETVCKNQSRIEGEAYQKARYAILLADAKLEIQRRKQMFEKK